MILPAPGALCPTSLAPMSASLGGVRYLPGGAPLLSTRMGGGASDLCTPAPSSCFCSPHPSSSVRSKGLLSAPDTHSLLGGAVVLPGARGSSCGTAKAGPRDLWQLAEDLAGGLEEGPIELPADFDPLGNVGEFSPLQIGASIVLTGTLAVLLYRAVTKRLQRAKELQFRSSGAIRAGELAEEARKAAILGLKREPEVETPPPTALQTLLGALVAGAISLALYKFTTTVEAGFATQSVSGDYSVRNITITVRTIINGLCYLSTFVFAANSVGLTLYSLQLALFPGGFSSENSAPGPPIEEKKGDTRVD